MPSDISKWFHSMKGGPLSHPNNIQGRGKSLVPGPLEPFHQVASKRSPKQGRWSNDLEIHENSKSVPHWNT